MKTMIALRIAANKAKKSMIAPISSSPRTRYSRCLVIGLLSLVRQLSNGHGLNILALSVASIRENITVHIMDIDTIMPVKAIGAFYARDLESIFDIKTVIRPAITATGARRNSRNLVPWPHRRSRDQSPLRDE
jgi:hypothetical protein